MTEPDTLGAPVLATEATSTDLEFLYISEENETRLTMPLAIAQSKLAEVSASFEAEQIDVVDLPVRLYVKVRSILQEGAKDALVRAAFIMYYAHTVFGTEADRERFYLIGMREGRLQTFTSALRQEIDKRAHAFRTDTIPDLPIDEIRSACQDTRVEVMVASPSATIMYGLNQRWLPDLLEEVDAQRKAVTDLPGLHAIGRHALQSLMGAFHSCAVEGDEITGAKYAHAAASNAVTFVAHLLDLPRILSARYVILHFSPEGVYPMCFSEKEKHFYARMRDGLFQRYGGQDPETVAPPTLH